MLGSLAVAWTMVQGGRFLLSPLLPEIIESLSLTPATAGLALGAFQMVYAITQYPSGRLSDVSGRAVVVIPGLVVLVGAFLVLTATTTVLSFLLAMGLLGVGKGLFASPSRALVSDLFVENRGRALGIYTAGTDLGGLLAAGLSLAVVGGGLGLLGTGALGTRALELGWRFPFALVAVALVGVTILFGLWSREPLRFERPTGGLLATGRRLLGTAEQRETLIAYGLFYFVVGAWINFLPTYLADGRGLPAPLPQLLFAVVFTVGVAVKPAAGAISDRVPRRLVAVLGLLCAVLSLVVVTFAQTLAGLTVAIAIFAVGYKTQFPIVDALVMDAAPNANTGGDVGAARALFLGVGALGPVYMGAVATVASYELALAGLVASLLVAAGVLAWGLRR